MSCVSLTIIFVSFTIIFFVVHVISAIAIHVV